MKKTLFILISLIFLIASVQAFNFEDLTSPSEQNFNFGGSITTFTGNLTNLSQLQDTNVPSPANNEVLTWSSAQAKWISQVVGALSRWIINNSNGFLYNNSNTVFFNYTHLDNTIDSRSLNQTEGDERYVNIDGDNMTGNLNVSGGNVSADYFFGDGSQLTGISTTPARTDIVIDITSSTKRNVIWDISDADADEVIIQPEADIIPVFGGNVL